MSGTGTQRKYTVCNRDCPDACAIVATVDKGKVVRLEGDPNHPVTKGFLCYRTSRFLKQQYDPDRITTPLMRRGANLEPVSWEAALDFIAKKMSMNIDTAAMKPPTTHFSYLIQMTFLLISIKYFFNSASINKKKF